MGREIREVPANWEHPTKTNGDYIPLLGDSFTKALATWKERKKKWDEGFVMSFGDKKEWIPKEEEYASMSYEEWDGEKPRRKDYMPEWTDAQKTHIQLYETTTEGTPETGVYPKEEFEELCEYAANNCSTFADFKATKKQWMDMLKADFVHHRDGNNIFM